VTTGMENRSYASVKKPMPAMTIAVKWYHCVLALSKDVRTSRFGMIDRL
jgi:hypothetical protein